MINFRNSARALTIAVAAAAAAVPALADTNITVNGDYNSAWVSRNRGGDTNFDIEGSYNRAKVVGNHGGTTNFAIYGDKNRANISHNRGQTNTSISGTGNKVRAVGNGTRRVWFRGCNC